MKVAIPEGFERQEVSTTSQLDPRDAEYAFYFEGPKKAV